MTDISIEMPQSSRVEEVPPDPGALIESMRAFGYSLSAAIADLVDNSISAGATAINIVFHWAGPDSSISVLDDGHGMAGTELTNAMRLGSRSPSEERARSDLGRFGLGLKTASFSQATSLSVISHRHGTPTETRRWDLGYVTGTRTWSLMFHGSSNAERWAAKVDGRPSGTAVLLEGLDRLVGDAQLEDESAKLHFLRHADDVEKHLAMVFHRFLADPRGPTITVDTRPVEPWDPFLSGVAHVQRLPAERLTLSGSTIEVAPFVLPHFSKLDSEVHRRAAGPRGWNHQQGFYVYRERRLLVAGDWLGLPIQKEEHYKLARIQVDLDNTMDAAWQIDVRKATARIPRQLSHEMRRIADATRRRAADAYRYRGKQLARSATAERAFVWSQRIHDGSVTYRVDRRHPVVSQALSAAGPGRAAVEQVLRLVEETVPVTSIVMEARDRPDSDRAPFEGRSDELATMLRDAFAAIVAHGGKPNDALKLLAAREPFDSHPELVAALAEELQE